MNGKLVLPISKTPDESRSDIQYENRRVAVCVTKERAPRFIPSKPVVAVGSTAESKVDVMQPKVVRIGEGDAVMSPNRNKSEERDPSEVEASEYESATWHRCDDCSHVAGTGKSRAWETQVWDEQGMEEKEEEA
jgi:hypothetical protein